MFHMLPLGRRVQDKVERLVAGYMEDMLGELSANVLHMRCNAPDLHTFSTPRPTAASRVTLSSISAEALWEKSGRLQNVASEVGLHQPPCCSMRR
jgi:prolyl-tRNA synthetase